jgi:enoyl-CoA hydratase/carnithine racemase
LRGKRQRRSIFGYPYGMALHFAELHEDGWAGIALAGVPSLAALREEMEAVRALRTCHTVVLFGDAFEADDAPAPGARIAWLELFELPTLFAFDGDLRGPAFDLALACDIRVCGPRATLRATSFGTRRLLQLTGPAAAVEMLRRRGALDAAEALRSGLVSRVASGEGALACAAALASTISSRGPIATKLAKEAIWRGLDLPFDHALRFETDLTLLLQTTKDRAEGVRAFLEKRTPQFTGE